MELVEYAYNPAGKPRRSIPDLFGEMFLLHQRRAQLLAAESQAQQSQLQHSYQAVLEENRRLRQDCLRSGVEILWLQDAKRTLRAQIQSLQTRPEDRREEGQTGQTSTAVNMATQEPSDVPDLEEVPSPGTTSRSLPQEALEVKDQMIPVHQEMQASSLATPGDAVVPDLNSPDDCQVPPSAHPMDAGAPHSDGAPLSVLSHTPSCSERRGEDHSTDESGVNASRPPLTSELTTSQSSHPCLSRTPSPPEGGRSRPHRLGDLSDSGVSDVADSPPPHRRQRLHTRQLKSLTSDVECFDSDSQDSDIDNYLQEVERYQESLDTQSHLYSQYKGRTTLKVLIGVAPNGVITFTSDLYGGSASDKAITADCGLLQHLQPGDMVMADKGFTIRDILPEGVLLNILSFLVNGQFTQEEVNNNS
eukprot:superscaffoldBa00000650_g6305